MFGLSKRRYLVVAALVSPVVLGASVASAAITPPTLPVDWAPQTIITAVLDMSKDWVILGALACLGMRYVGAIIRGLGGGGVRTAKGRG